MVNGLFFMAFFRSLTDRWRWDPLIMSEYIFFNYNASGRNEPKMHQIRLSSKFFVYACVCVWWSAFHRNEFHIDTYSTLICWSYTCTPFRLSLALPVFLVSLCVCAFVYVCVCVYSSLWMSLSIINAPHAGNMLKTNKIDTKSFNEYLPQPVSMHHYRLCECQQCILMMHPNHHPSW